MLVVPAPLALVLGVVALARIQRRNQHGLGFAIAGVAVSGVVVVVAGLLASGLLHFSVWSTSGERGTPTTAHDRTVTVFDLAVGDCFDPGTGRLEKEQESLRDISAERKECDEPHVAEAYGSFELPERTRFPGFEEISAVARQRCADLLLDYAMDPYAYGRLQTYFYQPDRSGWARGARSVLCWAGRPQENLTASLRNDDSVLTAEQVAYLTALKPAHVALLHAPKQSPADDLPTAREWAGRMAQAQAESATRLRQADLPPEIRTTVAELAAQLNASSVHWEQASRAENAEGFARHLRETQKNAGREQAVSIRTALGLPSESVHMGGAGDANA